MGNKLILVPTSRCGETRQQAPTQGVGIMTSINHSTVSDLIASRLTWKKND